MDKTIKILVVDDSEIVRINILHQLNEFYDEKNIFITDTIEKAWDILNNNTIDVALIDIYLPGKNGADLINDMLGDFKLKTVPIIVITGTAEDSYVKASFKKYVYAYLHKPIDKTEMLHSIREAIC